MSHDLGCCGDPADCMCPPVAPGESLVGSLNVYDQLILLRGELDCRIEHGAESGGHLEYVLSRLDAMLHSGR